MTPIVLIPGLLCTAELFAPQIAALWPYGPVTVASTLDGDSMAGIASSILAAAPPRFALAGISMGGYLSMEIMRQAPERVVKLALLDTTARPDAGVQTALRRNNLAEARTGNYAALLARILPALLHPDHRSDEALLDALVRMGLNVGVEGFVRQTEAVIGRADSRPHLKDISVPTLVLVGDQDQLTPPDRSQEMADAIPGARMVVIANSGHASTLEQPEAVNRALVDWIAS